MEKQLQNLRATLVMPKDYDTPSKRNLVGCFDKLDVEHIRNGQTIYRSEEKNNGEK